MCECPLKKHTSRNFFVYLGNIAGYCIFNTQSIICILFSTNCHVLHNFIFFCSNNELFINTAQKFKYQPSNLKVKQCDNVCDRNSDTVMRWVMNVVEQFFCAMKGYRILRLCQILLIHFMVIKTPNTNS